MGWFGGSSSNAASSPSASTTDFRSEDTHSFQGLSSSNFATPSSSSNTEELERFSVALQHQILVQTVITSMADTAFNRCIQGKPGDSLSGRDVACIHATVGKWLDTNDFMRGRMAKKEQTLMNSQ